MLTSPDPQLTFGTLNLIGTAAELTANGYHYEALGDDTDWGNPVPIDEKIISWLQDGAIVARKGYDNREMNIRILIVANDSNLLAVAESALMLETGKPNLLIWTPPDGDGEPCVFSVVMSNLEHVFDDLNEDRIERLWGLRIQAEPFVRAQDLTVVESPAPAGGATVTSLGITGSATGWASEITDPAGTVTTGGLAITPPPIVAQANITLAGLTRIFAEKTGLSQSLAGTPYLMVQVNTILGAGVSLAYAGIPTIVVNGFATTPIAQYQDNYWVDTTPLGVSTLNSLGVALTVGTSAPGSHAAVMRIEAASRADEIDSGSTGRQLSRVLSIAGSAPTQGSLLIADAADDALGDVLVYTCPNFGGLNNPDLRQFLSSGNSAATSSALVSGFSTDLSTLHTFDIPAAGLAPGGHLLLARVKAEPGSEGPQEFTWAAKARMGSVNLAEPQSGVTTIDITTSYTVVTIATLNLPPRKLGSDGVVRIELTAEAFLTLLDEAWIFNVETGRLTQVACGTASTDPGGPANLLWLDSPTVSSPVPAVYLGTATDRSDAYHAGPELSAFGIHEFVPPSTSVYIVTTKSAQADATLSHYARFHTHVVSPAA